MAAASALFPARLRAQNRLQLWDLFIGAGITVQEQVVQPWYYLYRYLVITALLQGIFNHVQVCLANNC